MWKWSPPVVMVGLAAVLAVGIIVGVLLVPAMAPASISATAPVLSAPAREVRTVDAQDATLSVKATAPQRLSAPATGTVTSDACTAGATVSSGSAGLSVDDAVMIYLASSRPLWRDMTIGDSGEDVRSLQSELTRLGYPAQTDGKFGSSTLNAVIGLAKHLGAIDAATWSMFPASRFVWLPASPVTTVSCDVQLGGKVSAGDSIATLPQGVSSAAVTPLPANVMPGDRVIVAGNLTLAVDAAGAVSSVADLRRLAESSAYGEYARRGSVASADSPSTSAATSAAGISIQYQLARAVTVFSVPAAAVYNASGTSACVISDNQRRSVTIAGSQLGQTFVIPRDRAKIGTVSLAVTKAPSCR